MPKRKERPGCREAIIRDRLFPAELYERADGRQGARPLALDETWSRVVAVTPESGFEPRFLSDGLTKQMSKMLEEGYFSQSSLLKR